jgi:predicted dehydrogenase
MLRFGVIGYGNRIRGIINGLSNFGVEYQIAALTDPRGEQLKAECEPLKDTVLYEDADEMLDQEDLDGVLVGTRCSLHTPSAVKVAARNLPLFLEKPVATSLEQVQQLVDAFAGYTSEVVVSFPLRLTSICLTVKEIIASGRLGEIAHVQAWNNVSYGWTYFGNWYRDTNETGGLFLQKATHDFDYISFLLDARPQWVCAMTSRHIYGGDKPADLTCNDCPDTETCMESPFNLYYRRSATAKVEPNNFQCMFAESIQHEDSGNALLEFENGVQAAYSQNFFARNQAAARGARLLGYHGTVEFDWYTGEIKVMEHHSLRNDTIRFEGGVQSHFGGDKELGYDFLQVVQGRGHSRSPIDAGIISALTCLRARESADSRAFQEVVL